jgi:hypothetical protein
MGLALLGGSAAVVRATEITAGPRTCTDRATNDSLPTAAAVHIERSVSARRRPTESQMLRRIGRSWGIE